MMSDDMYDYDECCDISKSYTHIREFPYVSTKWGWKGKLLVAVDRDLDRPQVMGFVYFNIPRGKDYLYIYYIAVAKEFQGKSVAQALFQTLLELPRGFSRLKIKTKPTNTRALRFFQKLGFLEALDEKDTYYKVL